MTSNTFQNRVQQRIADLAIGPVELATANGLERNFIRDIVVGEKKSVRGENLFKLAAALQTNTDWLLGKLGASIDNSVEPRRLSDEEAFAEEQEELRSRSAESEGRAYLPGLFKPRVRGAIPELDVKLGAGEGQVGEVLQLPLGGESYSGHAIVSEWLFPEQFLRAELGTSVANTVVMPVRGDSMEPTYRPGDRVLVDLTQKTHEEDTVYVISDGESAPRMKRLVAVIKSKPRRVLIVSDNPAIPDQEIALSEITILGRVVGQVCRR